MYEKNSETIQPFGFRPLNVILASKTRYAFYLLAK